MKFVHYAQLVLGALAAGCAAASRALPPPASGIVGMVGATCAGALTVLGLLSPSALPPPAGTP